jgi:hypothetical protein
MARGSKVAAPRPSRAARFTQRDLTRALKAAVAAGLKVVGTRIEIDGTLVLTYGDAGDVVSSGNPLDREFGCDARV